MPQTYYDSELTGQQIEDALEAIDGVIAPANNGKVLCIVDGKISAKSASEWADVPVLEPVTITENGTTTPPAGVDGFNSVTVNVQGGGSAVIQALSVTQNGTYSPPSGVDGYAPVTVNVSSGGSSFVTPDYQGFAYSYVALNEGYYQSDEGKIYYSSYFHVQANKQYALFVGGVESDRNRCHFYSGKSFSDFSQYVENSGPNQQIYTATDNISGSSDIASNIRFVYTPSSDGEIVYVTSRSSGQAIAYCVELP